MKRLQDADVYQRAGKPLPAPGPFGVKCVMLRAIFIRIRRNKTRLPVVIQFAVNLEKKLINQSSHGGVFHPLDLFEVSISLHRETSESALMSPLSHHRPPNAFDCSTSKRRL